MNIDQVRFHGFGQFVNKTLLFQPGLNVIQAPNESGKSTLLQGIFALLFGAAQEGLRVRRETEWYASFRPWLIEQYGGEIDYTLDGTPYRLIRNLQKGRVQEQLLNLYTGEELQSQFLLDQRKERKMIETQLGLGGELYRRIAYLTSYPVTSSLNKKQEQWWHQKLVEKLGALMAQGDEVALTSIVRHLDHQLEEIGKTDISKQKPLGMLTQKQKKLSNMLEQEKSLRDEGLKAKMELQNLHDEQAEMETQYKKVTEQLQRISLTLQSEAAWYQYEILYQNYQTWKDNYQKQMELKAKVEELELQRKQMEPLYRMQLEDLEELQHLHYQHQYLEQQILALDSCEHTEKSNYKEPWLKLNFVKWIGAFTILTISFAYFSPFLAGVTSILAILLWILPAYYLRISNNKIERREAWKQEEDQNQRAKYQKEKSGCDKQLAWWASRVGTNDLQMIRNWWTQTQAVEKIEWELDRLLQNKQTMNQEEGVLLEKKWSEYLKQISHQYQGAYCMQQDRDIKIDEIEETREVLQRSIQLLSVRIGERRKSVMELESRIKEIQQLHVQWENVTVELQKIRKEKEAIELAKEVIKEAYHSRQIQVGPILQQISSEWIKKVTNNRYECLYADFSDHKETYVRIPETGRKEKIDLLSTGTLMQMTFALKMAIIQYISIKSSILLPLLLDDCFVYYDDDRLSAILPLLVDLAENHQIILCTCHHREQKILDQLGKPYHLVSLTS